MNIFNSTGMKNLKTILSYSFSNEDIKRYLGNDTKIFEYQELNNFNSIDEFLPNKKDFCIILIETKQNSGHWTALMKNNGLLEWFDSYGLGVDKELNFISNFMRRTLGQSEKQLTKLIDSSPYECVYNHVQLQTHKSFDNTCGRWVCSRILHFKKGLNLNQYIDYLNFVVEQNNFKNILKYDLVVIKEISYTP